jgi:hypothetical protein
MGLLSSIFGTFGCKNNNTSFITKQITIAQLDKELELLRAGKTEFDFIGITSNGDDCIYFVKSNDKFIVEFEAMAETQISFIEKLKEYAKSKGFRYKMTTYGNKPLYDTVKQAPVLQIETNTDIQETVKIGEEIQNSIFGNNSETNYDVVP